MSARSGAAHELARSRRTDRQRPLLGVKRTALGLGEISSYDPKRTLASPRKGGVLRLAPHVRGSLSTVGATAVNGRKL